MINHKFFECLNDLNPNLLVYAKVLIVLQKKSCIVFFVDQKNVNHKFIPIDFSRFIGLGLWNSRDEQLQDYVYNS